MTAAKTDPSSPGAMADLVIMGGGPAGMAAAIQAARAGYSVTVLERNVLPKDRVQVGWMSPSGVLLCQQLGLTADVIAAQPFQGITLYNWEFSEQTVISDDDLAGWYIDRIKLATALDDLARQAGVTIIRGLEVANLQLNEDHVAAEMEDHTEIEGRLAIIADGVFSRGAEMAELIAAGRMGASLTCAQMLTPAQGATPGLAAVLGREADIQLGTIVTSADRVRITISGRGEPNELMRKLHDLCDRAQAAGIIPQTGSEVEAGGILPAAAALEMDTHVGKRCLLVGDAGGFVAAFSNEGLYPAMRSGMIAADVAGEALGSALPQDALATFGVAWRQELADYLRMPNADLGLLLPLIFRSEPMAKRVARAFLLGSDL
jgi:flavin-dependent dehydrogenase